MQLMQHISRMNLFYLFTNPTILLHEAAPECRTRLPFAGPATCTPIVALLRSTLRTFTWFRHSGSC
jgi:hypothetical protein